MTTKDRATELEWLKWFYGSADFGPAHEDVVYYMAKQFKRETGKNLPEGYYGADEEDEDIEDEEDSTEWPR